MKKRNLSGEYFSVRDDKTGELSTVVFEELPETMQDEILDGLSERKLKIFVKQLARTLYALGEKFDLVIDDK